jgi:hypothetical protein
MLSYVHQCCVIAVPLALKRGALLLLGLDLPSNKRAVGPQQQQQQWLVFRGLVQHCSPVVAIANSTTALDHLFNRLQ